MWETGLACWKDMGCFVEWRKKILGVKRKPERGFWCVCRFKVCMSMGSVYVSFGCVIWCLIKNLVSGKE